MKRIRIISLIVIIGFVIILQAQFTQIELFSGFDKTDFTLLPSYAATIEVFTTQMGLSSIVVFSVIMIEFFGSIFLILGFFRWFWVLSSIRLFLGIIFTTQLGYGFFMNWFGKQARKEFEYPLLIIGLTLTIMVNGNGKMVN